MVPLVHRYYETLRPPDSLFAALRFLRLAIPRSVCVSSPFGRRRQADGSSRSLLYRLLPIRLTSWNCQDLPCSRETLMTIRPALRPRRDRVRATGPRVNVLDTAPAPKHNEGSPRLQISGLNHTAFGLAVYASKWRLPATAQDSLPAAGPALPDGVSYPQGFDERFHIFEMILLSRATWRKVRPSFKLTHNQWGQTELTATASGVRPSFKLT